MATKKYICAFCARAFTRSEHKQRHERSHTNEKPFHCLHCTSSFVRRDLLQRHCRTVHNFQLNASQIQQVKQDAQGSQQQQNSEQQQSQIQSQHYPQQLYGERLQVDESQLRAENSNEVPSTSNVNSNNNTSQIINPDTGPPPKRKKSTDANAEPLINHDLIYLLSITRKLESLLGSFDPSNIEYQLNDYFLIGYVNLLSSEVDYKIFDRLLKDLFQYLNSFNVSNNHPLPQHGDYESGLHDFSAGKKTNEISNFKIGILYAIVSLGYCCNDKHKLAIKFFLQSWNLLIRKLIPNYNNNNNVLDQIEILNNLYLLSYIFLEFDYGKFDSEEFEEEGTLINDDIILNYLNDISFIILSNLNNMSCSNENILDANLSMFWNIYILLSTYLKKNPPKFYSFFINKKVISADVNGTDSERTSLGNGESAILSSVMMKLSKSFISLNRPQTDNEARFLNTIIIATLSNELKSLINGDNFLIYTTGNCLHNAIILINKSINVHDTLTNNPSQVYEGSRHSSLSSVATTSLVSNNNQKHEKAVKLFELFKKNIIINSPLKFHELLNNYLFIPSHFYNWELLSITIQEINMNFPINQYFLDYLLAPNPQSNSLNLQLANYFNPKQNPIEINNNLSIISFPIIFFTKYLSLDIVNLSKYNVLQLNFINVFIVEWYMIMHKVMIMMWNNPRIFDDNYILQNLVYLLLDNKKALSKKLNIDKGSNYGNGQFLDAGKDEEFLFNHKWFWILKLKFDLIYESWMNLIKSEITNKCKIDGKMATNISGSYPVRNNCTSSTYRYSVNNLSLLKANVNKFINDLIQNDMPKFIQEERFAAGPPGSVYGVNSFGPPMNNADASATAAAATVATMQYTNNNGISHNPTFMNYSTYNVLNGDFDHIMGNHSYRRANSITLGLLANANNADQTNNISPAMSNSSSASSSSNRSVIKNSIGGNMKPDTNYHSKPINPPSILSSDVPVLPSILKGRSYNMAYSNEYSNGPNDLKSKEVDRNVKITPDSKPMIPGVVRKH